MGPVETRWVFPGTVCFFIEIMDDRNASRGRKWACLKGSSGSVDHLFSLPFSSSSSLFHFPQTDAVLNVDFSGPETCAVTVRCPVAPNFWTDILILLKTANGWQVVSKTYKTEDSADPATIHDASAEDLVQISGLLKTYFDGLYEGDTAKLGAVFHECAYLRSLDDKGQVTNLARDDWFKAVNSRAKPSETGLARADKILSVTQVGPDLAVAKVKCQIVPRYFTDFLTMIKEERGWKIVSKVGLLFWGRGERWIGVDDPGGMLTFFHLVSSRSGLPHRRQELNQAIKGLTKQRPGILVFESRCGNVGVCSDQFWDGQQPVSLCFSSKSSSKQWYHFHFQKNNNHALALHVQISRHTREKARAKKTGIEKFEGIDDVEFVVQSRQGVESAGYRLKEVILRVSRIHEVRIQGCPFYTVILRLGAAWYCRMKWEERQWFSLPSEN